MKTRTVVGGGGVRLHVVEAGNTRGRPILFIHGFSQCWLVWSRQMSSELAADYRLVAMDIRGHGLSEKPLEAYGDSRLWADDLNAVIRELGLDQPVLCGWSYGPLLILDYIRHHGEDAIGGINFVGGITKLGSEEAMSFITPELLGLAAGLFSTHSIESVRSLESLLGLFFVQELSPEEFFLMLGYNVSVPPYVRQALFSRSFDNDDLLPTIRKPVLIVHGERDSVVKPAVVAGHRTLIPHARVQMLPEAGHACFWDDPAAFNRCLSAFAEEI